MNDNEPIAVGDRVRLRQFPDTQGVVWDVVPRENMVIVEWDDPDEDVYVREPRRWLEKINHVADPPVPPVPRLKLAR
jgi:hypothetical protein